MTSYTGNGATQAYAYDANGNRMSLSIGGASYANTIAADSNRLLGTTGPVPAKTNTYDLAGNLTNDATVTYTYTSRGRMSSATVGTAKTSYLYNGLGQRVRQVTGTAVNPAGLLVYDEAGHIIGEYNSSTGKASKEFVYLGDTPVGVHEQVATGTAPDQAHATNVYFVYTDHLDTPCVITRSPDGQMVWRWDSGDPFGLLPPNDNPAGLGAFTFNLRMPGSIMTRARISSITTSGIMIRRPAGMSRAIRLGSTVGPTLTAMSAEIHFLWSILMDFKPFQFPHRRLRQPLPAIRALVLFLATRQSHGLIYSSQAPIYPLGHSRTGCGTFFTDQKRIAIPACLSRVGPRFRHLTQPIHLVQVTITEINV